jgi:hypothetical protein
MLQTEIALSTMEAEYVALRTSCRDLFPLIDITGEAMNVGVGTASSIIFSRATNFEVAEFI